MILTVINTLSGGANDNQMMRIRRRRRSRKRRRRRTIRLAMTEVDIVVPAFIQVVTTDELKQHWANS